MTIAAALAEVHTRIERASRECGRDAATVKLIAVSKEKPPACIREAYSAGQRAFGENYAQELASKAAELSDLQDLEWHFIGHLQTNKARVVARHAHFVHTVDSPVLARELGRRAAKERTSALPVLIEVNVGGEPQKAGATPGDIAEVMAAVRAEPALVLRGLMTVPPAADPAASTRVFETLSALRSLHGGPAALPDLSMGMSGDLEAAIRCGATLVRVGSAIFGPRAVRAG
ncbi:MAG TPA: YggS family pyridoxal phosphate-dependent enzyme [Polyangiaceae bacterium]|nr:YggS family pyridoxal phosphate-dependent enzyme [Polyangiaceae bacterium]